jgi:hypothetical protein
VHNYDDPPLRSLPVRLFGRPRAVVFHHEPPHRYRLFYGQAQAPPPRYDLAQIFPYLSAQKFNPLALTETKPNPAFVEPPPPRQPWTEEHPALLWAGLLGVVAVLGLLLWRAFTKVRAAMDDRSGEEE